MMTCHELFGFMSPALATEILETTAAQEKEMYRTVTAAVAESRKLRPAFFIKKPRTERNAQILESLSKPRLEPTADAFLRHWLLKTEKGMLVDFLNALEVPHKEGVIDEMPRDISAERLRAAVDKLLEKYPREKVIVYLNVFYAGNKEACPALGELLHADARLQLA